MRILYTAHDSQLVCPNHLMQNPITGQRCTKCMEKIAWCCVQGKCIHGSTVQSILAAFEHTLYRNLKTYRRIDQIICPSRFMQERLATDSVLKSRLILLRNFADMETSDGSRKKGLCLLFLADIRRKRNPDFVKGLPEFCRKFRLFLPAAEIWKIW